ncbi:MAG: hypothetical protein AB1626_02195, partial [Candidatus Micrarchaeota archaeon]
KACDNEVFYSYGGGIKNGDQAAEVIRAGAHGIQIGTAFEGKDVAEKVARVKKAILEEGRKHVK